MKILYGVGPQTRFDRFLVAFCNQNMDFNAASSEVSRPVPTASWLTPGIRPTRISGEQNSHG